MKSKSAIILISSVLLLAGCNGGGENPSTTSVDSSSSMTSIESTTSVKRTLVLNNHFTSKQKAVENLRDNLSGFQLKFKVTYNKGTENEQNLVWVLGVDSYGQTWFEKRSLDLSQLFNAKYFLLENSQYRGYFFDGGTRWTKYDTLRDFYDAAENVFDLFMDQDSHYVDEFIEDSNVGEFGKCSLYRKDESHYLYVAKDNISYCTIKSCHGINLFEAQEIKSGVDVVAPSKPTK